MNHEKIYNQIIEQAKLEMRKKGKGIYYERHHIIPRCLGGSNNKDNLVLLTAKEHFICHKLLCEMYPENKKLIVAIWLMTGHKGGKYKSLNISSKEYERYKILHANSIKGRVVSEETRKKLKAAKSGKSLSEDSKRKISETKKLSGAPGPWLGKKRSEETKQKIREKRALQTNLRNRPHSEETKKKISESKKGEIRTEEFKARISQYQQSLLQTQEAKIERASRFQKNKI